MLLWPHYIFLRLGQDYGYTAQVPQLIPLPQASFSLSISIFSTRTFLFWFSWQDYSNLINSISSFTCPRSIGEESKTPRQSSLRILWWRVIFVDKLTTVNVQHVPGVWNSGLLPLLLLPGSFLIFRLYEHWTWNSVSVIYRVWAFLGYSLLWLQRISPPNRLNWMVRVWELALRTLTDAAQASGSSSGCLLPSL